MAEEGGLPTTTATSSTKKGYNLQETVSVGCSVLSCCVDVFHADPLVRVLLFRLREVVVDNVWQYVHIGAAGFLFYEDNLLGLYSLLGFAALCCTFFATRGFHMFHSVFLPETHGNLPRRRYGCIYRRSDSNDGRRIVENCHPSLSYTFSHNLIAEPPEQPLDIIGWCPYWMFPPMVP